MLESGAKGVAAGEDHSIILKQDGNVWATGKNNFGQLGTGSAVPSTVYIQVVTNGVQAIAAGDWHSMVAKADGSLWATGANMYGQLGDGSTTKRNTFVRVMPRDLGALYTLLLMVSATLDLLHLGWICSSTWEAIRPILVSLSHGGSHMRR